MKEDSIGSGITIVELVIILATVVILIGFLLPGNKSADSEYALSADKCIINEMNIALSSKYPMPRTSDEAIEALKESGFTEDCLIPESENCVFVFGKREQIILLMRMDDDNNSILYPEKYFGTEYDPERYFIITPAKTSDN